MSFLIIHDHSHGIYHILPSILGIFHQDFLGVGCPEPPWLRADLAICAAAGRISAGHLQKNPPMDLTGFGTQFWDITGRRFPKFARKNMEHMENMCVMIV
jgi:hypothetical protein